MSVVAIVFRLTLSDAANTTALSLFVPHDHTHLSGRLLLPQAVASCVCSGSLWFSNGVFAHLGKSSGTMLCCVYFFFLSFRWN